MSKYRNIICDNLGKIQYHINELLAGKDLSNIKVTLSRMNRGGTLPEWFNKLEHSHTLPNLDGKTIGSVVEKLLACVLEKYILDSKIILHINPAKGVDIPELELGIKSPSENFCTSEPYFSAYERLIGNENDALVLLTDYQSSKRSATQTNGLRLQIKDLQYLKGSEIADMHLCETAEALKLIYKDNEDMLRRAIHFLAYINQGDWEAAKLLDLIRNVIISGKSLVYEYKRIESDFNTKNKKYISKSQDPIATECLERIKKACENKDSIILQSEGWVSRTLNENWHSPSKSVWNKILTNRLEGRIGMSFALQWRYNFSSIFRDKSKKQVQKTLPTELVIS